MKRRTHKKNFWFNDEEECFVLALNCSTYRSYKYDAH